MAEFSYKTSGNASPKNKPRVYFTCHPEDFSRCFEKISEDIFKTHDCAIYYTADMTAEIEEENKEADLGQMNLFVVPITFRLLTTPNRAMDSDIAYAKTEHIPILPIMMELGIDAVYSRPDKFGELQYINPYSHDLTEIRYEEKLKKYLESVLISDEMAKSWINEGDNMKTFTPQKKTEEVELHGTLAEFRQALRDEIEHIEKSGQSSTVLFAGRKVENRGEGFWYRFSVEYAPVIPADTPCRLTIGKEKMAALIPTKKPEKK